MALMNELKPCPFCDGKAERDIEEEPDELNDAAYSIVCSVFGIIQPTYYNKEDAVKAWNRRGQDESV